MAPRWPLLQGLDAQARRLPHLRCLFFGLRPPSPPLLPLSHTRARSLTAQHARGTRCAPCRIMSARALACRLLPGARHPRLPFPLCVPGRSTLCSALTCGGRGRLARRRPVRHRRTCPCSRRAAVRAATRARPSPVPPLHARRLSAPCTSPPHLVAALLATPPRPSPVGRPINVPRWHGRCVPIPKLRGPKLGASKLGASKLGASTTGADCPGSRPSHPTLRPALPRSSPCTRCSDRSRPLAPREFSPGTLAPGNVVARVRCASRRGCA